MWAVLDARKPVVVLSSNDGIIVALTTEAKAIGLRRGDPIFKDRLALSRTIDDVNRKFGLKTVRLAVEGEKSEVWKVKSEHRSPNYLTDLDELLTIRI